MTLWGGLRSSLIGALALVPGALHATECGELRLQSASLKAAATVEQGLGHADKAKDAQTKLKAIDKQREAACAPRKVTISALPLGYVSLPPGNASHASFDPGEKWRLSLATNAGASSGVVFAEMATVDLPHGLHWDTAAGGKTVAGDLMIAYATDATLTVEEPQPGKGVWKVEVKSRPQLVSLAAARSCADGKGDAGAKLTPAQCQVLVRADPLGGKATGLPERARAVLLGEWQYGGGTVIELGDEELSEIPESAGAPRLELNLDLSAPIPGISDGKKLTVTLEANGQTGGGGAGLKLAQDCGTDAACDKQRLAVEIWYDRVYGVPFWRTPPAAAGTATGAKIGGKITDRLSRPIAGQRVRAIVAGRHAVTMTDSDGEYRFEGLSSGDATIYPISRKMSGKPRADLVKTVPVGMGEQKAPPILVDKLFE